MKQGSIVLLVVIVILLLFLSLFYLNNLPSKSNDTDISDDIVSELVSPKDIIYIELPDSVTGSLDLFTEEDYLKDKPYLLSAVKIENGLKLGMTKESHKEKVADLVLWLKSTMLVMEKQIDYVESISINEETNKIIVIVNDDNDDIEEVRTTLSAIIEYKLLFEGKPVDFEVEVLDKSGKVL